MIKTTFSFRYCFTPLLIARVISRRELHVFTLASSRNCQLHTIRGTKSSSRSDTGLRLLIALGFILARHPLILFPKLVLHLIIKALGHELQPTKSWHWSYTHVFHVPYCEQWPAARNPLVSAILWDRRSFNEAMLQSRPQSKCCGFIPCIIIS